MVEQIAHKDVGHIVNGAPPFGAIVSAARVPAVRSIYVDLPSDVAVSQPASWNDGHGIQVVVDAVEVPAQLWGGDQPNRVSGHESCRLPWN